MLNRNDSLNTKARELSVTLQDATIVTTEMVLTELLNNASIRGNEKRRLTAEAIVAWTASSQVEIVAQTSEQFHAALELYRARLDQSWNLVDCASFIVMERRQIQEALAFDYHFEQAGFTALLRKSE